MTRRRAQTRERLIAAAYEVFGELGIRDAPVELICERAGFTRGAFYSNFASKEELFLAVHQVQAQERIVRLHAAVNASISAADVTDPDVATDVLRQAELRPATAAAEAWFQEALAEILTTTLNRLGRRLTVDAHSAVVTIIALYEATLKRAILNNGDDGHYVTEVLPRLFAALIVPAEEEVR